ncbi:MAG: pyridoxal-phosphate dependent enzyme, partial [Deltaproteobacteria bacterium]
NKKAGEAEFYQVEELGRDLFPTSLDYDLIDKIYTVTDKNCFNTAREICRWEGILAGGSAGGVMWAALQEAKQHPPGTNIVVIFPDSSERYLSKQIYDFLNGITLDELVAKVRFASADSIFFFIPF